MNTSFWIGLTFLILIIGVACWTLIDRPQIVGQCEVEDVTERETLFRQALDDGYAWVEAKECSGRAIIVAHTSMKGRLECKNWSLGKPRKLHLS